MIVRAAQVSYDLVFPPLYPYLRIIQTKEKDRPEADPF
jgi:hypothetical protein